MNIYNKDLTHTTPMIHNFTNDIRFQGIKPFEPRVPLAIPTMHDGAEMVYIKEAYDTGWMTTVGKSIDVIEELVSDYMGGMKTVALINGTSALHLAVKLAAERLYGSSSGVSTPAGKGAGGALYGKRVFCTDMTFDASVNPIVYEGGEPVFIDSEDETWNMDPEALRKAFELHPDVRIVMFVHIYGVPGKIQEIKRVCEEHGALLIEDAAEALGATIDGKPCGSFGDYAAISFNGNKIITGSSGGMLLTHDDYSAEKARKWSTQSRENAPWYEHEEIGYNYRISNLIASVIRGQWPFLDSNIALKKAIYERYQEGLQNLPLKVHGGGNYWLSCALIDADAMEPFAMADRHAAYQPESGKSCPTELLEAMKAFNAEGRPIWKPMHLQPLYRGNEYVTKQGRMRGNSNAYIVREQHPEVTSDIFQRGLCLPSDVQMTPEQQDIVMNIIRRCFR